MWRRQHSGDARPQQARRSTQGRCATTTESRKASAIRRRGQLKKAPIPKVMSTQLDHAAPGTSERGRICGGVITLVRVHLIIDASSEDERITGAEGLEAEGQRGRNRMLPLSPHRRRRRERG